MPSGVCKRKVISTQDIVCPMCGTSFCVSIKSKQKYCSKPCRWKDPDQRKQMSLSKKGQHPSKETRALLRQRNIERYSKPEEHIKTSNGIKRSYEKDPELGAKKGKKIKQTYIDHPEKRKHQSDKTLERYKDPLEHKKTSASGKKSYAENPDRAEKLSLSLSEYFSLPESREKARKGQKRRYENPIEREKSRQRRLKQKVKNKDTKQEIKIKDFLISNGIKFEFQKTGLGHPDFYLIEYNILIFADGNYYHGNPNRYKAEDLYRKRITYQEIWDYDNKITKELESQGYIVLRFWEDDVNKNFDFVTSAILETISCIKVLS